MKLYLSNKETAEEILILGENKGKYSFSKTLLLGIMGGIFIALSALGNLISNFSIGGGVGKFIGSLVFPTGLMLVVLVGGSLFTGDALGSLAVYKGKTKISTYFKNLSAVWLGNLIGSIFIAYATYFGGNFSNPDFSNFVVGVATHKIELSFFTAIISGFLCNILVALAVWFSLATKQLSGKILAIWFPIMLFILGGFQHIVANMYYISIGKILLSSAYTFPEIILHFIAVTIGNFISGAIFLPFIYEKLYLKD